MSRLLASLLACAVLVGAALLWLHRSPRSGPAATAAVDRGTADSNRDGSTVRGAGGSGTGSRPLVRTGDVAALDGRLAPRLEPTGDPATGDGSEISAAPQVPDADRGAGSTHPPGHPRARVGGELGRRARIIEARANRELERLVPVLGLTESQQDRVFDIIAKSSPLYGGGMAVVVGDPAYDATGDAVPAQQNDHRTAAGGAPANRTGDSGASAPRPVEEQIHEVLDPEQQIAYEQVVLDDFEWWEDWLVKQENYLNQATGELVDVSAALLADDGGSASAAPLPGSDPDITSEKTVTRPVTLPSQ